MTVQEAIVEVFERLGEPSDLPIETNGNFNIGAFGSVRILAALNRAQDYVATYKVPSTSNGRPIVFRSLVASTRFEFTVVSGTLPTQTDTTFKTILLPSALLSSAAGRFNRWIAVFDDAEPRKVMRHTLVAGVGTLVLDVPLGADASAKTLKLYQVEYGLGSGTDYISVVRPIEVIRVIDMLSHSELPCSAEELHWSAASIGIPSTFAKRGTGIVFDCACSDATRTFEIDYLVYPTYASVATASLSLLPSAFHDAIVLWAIHWGYQRMMETTAAYAAKRDFEDYMRTLQTQIDVEDIWTGNDRIIPEVQ
jgi:hypothetical protein